jgi:hypothetical protein
MAEGIRISSRQDADGSCHVELHVSDPDLAGKRATVRIERRAKVKRSNPVHKSEVLVERDIALVAGVQAVPIGDAIAGVFCYAGADLDLGLVARVTVDDGVIFDTKVEVDLPDLGALPPRSQVPDARSVHSPPDRFDFFANLRAIPVKARAIVLGLLLVGGPVIAINALVGVRDQFQPEDRVWFYDHTGDDGSESPAVKALAGSGAVGMALWLAIRAQLRKYMRFEARWPLARLERGSRCRADEIVSGEAGVALEQVRVRVVAYNREHGQHRVEEGSGKNRRTVTREFTSDGRGVVLFDRLLPYVPAGDRLAAHLDAEIEFAPVFDALYPPCRIGGTHGLSLAVEAQLLHPAYVDHDVVLDPGNVDRRVFQATKA